MLIIYYSAFVNNERERIYYNKEIIYDMWFVMMIHKALMYSVIYLLGKGNVVKYAIVI